MGAEADPNAKKATPEEPKKGSFISKKLVRIVTVIAYVSAVSGAGFLLSIYYIFLWDPQIRGVRPPGYLQSGEMIGMPQARVASVPEALKGGVPIPFPHKMSKEFMDAYYRNATEERGEGQAADVVNQSTSKVPDLAAEHAANSGHNPPISTAGVNYHGQDDSSLQKSNAEQLPARPQQDHREPQHRRAQHHEQRGPPLTANA
ncbi:uncharacterized protein LOC125025004 isoform X1 [Penaeus chinensis]|uniref:uncharacterized protein LOC125025004 isoform X1 n=1 Tax=Penaeus chinensis TaxID=139456 RepID=UPI001FB84ACE|nr:uncharacterized protein LOC125025004 isoform X1 [Penaeus chinensis]